MHLSVSFVVLSVLLLSNVDASPVPSLEVSGHENAASDRALFARSSREIVQRQAADDNKSGKNSKQPAGSPSSSPKSTTTTTTTTSAKPPVTPQPVKTEPTNVEKVTTVEKTTDATPAKKPASTPGDATRADLKKVANDQIKVKQSVGNLAESQFKATHPVSSKLVQRQVISKQPAGSPSPSPKSTTTTTTTTSAKPPVTPQPVKTEPTNVEKVTTTVEKTTDATPAATPAKKPASTPGDAARADLKKVTDDQIKVKQSVGNLAESQFKVTHPVSSKLIQRQVNSKQPAGSPSPSPKSTTTTTTTTSAKPPVTTQPVKTEPTNVEKVTTVEKTTDATPAKKPASTPGDAARADLKKVADDQAKVKQSVGNLAESQFKATHPVSSKLVQRQVISKQPAGSPSPSPKSTTTTTTTTSAKPPVTPQPVKTEPTNVEKVTTVEKTTDATPAKKPASTPGDATRADLKKVADDQIKVKQSVGNLAESQVIHPVSSKLVQRQASQESNEDDASVSRPEKQSDTSSPAPSTPDATSTEPSGTPNTSTTGPSSPQKTNDVAAARKAVSAQSEATKAEYRKAIDDHIKLRQSVGNLIEAQVKALHPAAPKVTTSQAAEVNDA